MQLRVHCSREMWRDVTGQAHFKKGNFPFNQDNILSIVQFPF